MKWSSCPPRHRPFNFTHIRINFWEHPTRRRGLIACQTIFRELPIYPYDIGYYIWKVTPTPLHTKVEIERNSLDARDNSVPPNCQSSTRDLFLHNAKHRLEHPLNHPPPPPSLSDTKRRVGVRFATITLFIFLSLFDLPNSIFVMMRTAHLKAIGDADGGRGERKNAV